MKPDTKKQPRVLVFSTPSCGYCTKAKRYLKQNGIKFKDIDITRDPEAARDVKRISGGSSVPVILMGNRAVVGFDKSKIDRILGLSNKNSELDD